MYTATQITVNSSRVLPTIWSHVLHISVFWRDTESDRIKQRKDMDKLKCINNNAICVIIKANAYIFLEDQKHVPYVYVCLN